MLVTEEPSDGTTRRRMEALAERMTAHGLPISANQCWRICSALDLKPWQVQSWMTSHDSEFWEKAGGLCGLYLNLPVNALVWSVDKKSGMQAKSRVNPTKPAVPGLPVCHEFEYRRHGMAVLFAALDVHDGQVAGWVTDSTKFEHFMAFLGDLVVQTPEGLDRHCIVDNLKTHDKDLVHTFSPSTPMYTCTSPRNTPVRSTTSSCSSPPLSGVSCVLVSSTSSTTWPSGSSPSPRTTSAGRRRSAGPTTAVGLKPRKSQLRTRETTSDCQGGQIVRDLGQRG
jgi:hypothetical protein